MAWYDVFNPLPELREATSDLLSGRFGSFFSRTAKYPLGLKPWSDLFRKLTEFPVPEANSPTYTWDGPQNAPAYDRPVPVVYGCVETGGLTLYQGGDSELRDVFVAVSEGTIRRIDDVRLNGVAWALLKGPSGTGARVETYTGTAAQNADPRFSKWRHQESYGGTGWNLKTSDTTPAVGTFEVLEDGAHVLVKVGVLYALNGPDSKHVDFKLEFRADGAGAWTDGGTFRVDLSKYQQGLEEVKVPLWATGDTDTAEIALNYSFTQGTKTCDVSVRQANASYRVVKSVTARAFTAGLYDLRLTYVHRAYDQDDASREIDGQLVLASAEIVETSGSQPYRHTAYIAATVPASDLAQGEATVTSRVAGRDTVEVWDPVSETWEDRWTNNPVWIARDLWLNSRYGAGQTAFDDVRAKAAAAYCDASLGTIATATVSSGGATPQMVYTGLAPGANNAGRERLDGYRVQNQAAEVRLCTYHDPATSTVAVDRVFDTAATALTFLEQRFRFDYTFDSQADVEEQIRRIAAHCRGVVWRDGGTLSFDIERARSPSAFQSGITTITPDLVLEGSFRAERRSGRDQPSGVALKYLDPDQTTRKQSALFGDASGRVEDLELYGARNPGQAWRAAAFAWNASRVLWVCSLRTSLATCALEPGDVVGVAHPVTGWGYDMTDPDAPVRDEETDKLFVVVSIADDGDTREYALREYDAALYSDTADRAISARPPSAFANPFEPPAAFSALRASNLGDLTNDGTYNPVIAVGWTHPQPDALGAVDLYGSRDAGVSWLFLARFSAQETSGRVTVSDWSGTLKLLALPVTQAGVQGVWADQPTAEVDVMGELAYVGRTTADLTYHVSTAGSDTTGDGSVGAPWRTLQHAVDRVPRRVDHAVAIKAASGTYAESVSVIDRVGAGSLTIGPETAAAVTVLPPTDPVEQPCFLLKRVGCRAKITGLELLSDHDAGGHLVAAYNCDRLHVASCSGGYDGAFTLGIQCFIYCEDSLVVMEGLTNAAGHDPIEYGLQPYRSTIRGYHSVGHYPITDPQGNVITTSPGEPDLARGLSATLFGPAEDCAVAEPRAVTKVPWDLVLTSATVTIPAAGAVGVGGSMTVDLKVGGSSILSAALSIAAGDSSATTTSFAVPGTVAAGAELELHVTAINSTTAAKGLLVELCGTQKGVL